VIHSPDERWLTLRRKALDQLELHKKEGRVDADILWLLDIVNSTESYYTTSSCSGRIQVIAGRHPGEKGRLRVLAKWHRPIAPEELLLVLNATSEENVWLSVHPPIMHIVARDIPSARRLLIAARNSGFKHSGIQGLGKRIVVEIMSMEKLEAPLRLKGSDIVSPEKYPLLVDAANELLLRGKSRLGKLAEAFKGVF